MENYYFYYLVPHTETQQINLSPKPILFPDKEGRIFERDNDDRIWALYKAITSVHFNAFKSTVSSNKFSQSSNEFSQYVNKFINYKNQDINGPNMIIFADHFIFNKPKLASLNICDKLEYSHLYTLKQFRKKSGIYDCILLKSDMYTPPRDYYYYKKPYNLIRVDHINEFEPQYRYDVIFYDVNLFKYIPGDEFDYMISTKLNMLLHLLTRLSQFLIKGGYLVMNIRQTYSYLLPDILKYLTTMFLRVVVCKPLSHTPNSFYTCVMCEDYKFKNDLPKFDGQVHRLYSSQSLTDFWNIFDDSLYNLRNNYINKLEHILSESNMGPSIKEMQTELVNKIIYIYNKLNLNVPAYVHFDQKYLDTCIYHDFDVLKFELKSGGNKQSLDDVPLQFIDQELFQYKTYLDSIDSNRYGHIAAKIRPLNKKFISKIIGYDISQAFIKMTEIIHETKLITSNKIKTLHICEAPGQFILAFITYCLKYNIQLDWKGNSLNPTHPENIERYGNDILNDVYGIIGNNPSRWLYGKDNTGDITKLNNIIELSSDKYDIVTSDCGLAEEEYGVQEDTLLFTNLCQIMIILLSLKIGGNACLKTFLPCSKKLTISLIYTLTQSFEQVFMFKPWMNQANSEIYIVCKSFKQVNREYLFQIYNNPETSINIFDEEYIETYIDAVTQLSNNVKYHIFRSIIMYYYLRGDIKDHVYKLTQKWINAYLT